MNKEKSLFLTSMVSAFVLPIALAVESLFSSRGIFCSLAILLIAGSATALALIFFRMKRKYEAIALKSLMLGSGVAVMILPGSLSIRLWSIVTWLVILVSVLIYTSYKKRDNNEKVKTLHVLKIVLMSLPILGALYYFKSQYIWLAVVALLLIFAALQRRDSRSYTEMYVEFVKVLIVSILVAFISTVLQYANIGLELFTSIDPGDLILPSFAALIILTFIFAFYFHKKDKRKEEEERLAKRERETEAENEKTARRKEQMLEIKKLILSGNIKYEDHLTISNLKKQIFWRDGHKYDANLTLEVADIMLRDGKDDDIMYLAVEVLEGMANYIKEKKTDLKLTYKGEDEIKRSINKSLSHVGI